jgi:hypothetical protein
MRNQVWLLLLIVGLSYGLPRPQDEEEDAEDAAEDEEYDVYDAVGDAAEGKLNINEDDYYFGCQQNSSPF